jgi:hypothetical protein
MAFAEADRVAIRHALGFGALFLQADPRLENAITSVQSVADGGTRPTNDTELAIKATLASIATLEVNLQSLWAQAHVSSVDEIKLDPYRGRALLCQEGRRLVRSLEAALSTTKRRDIFGAGASNPTGDSFADVLTGKRW